MICCKTKKNQSITSLPGIRSMHCGRIHYDIYHSPGLSLTCDWQSLELRENLLSSLSIKEHHSILQANRPWRHWRRARWCYGNLVTVLRSCVPVETKRFYGDRVVSYFSPNIKSIFDQRLYLVGAQN